MWPDADGVAHTVAVPHWSAVVALPVVGRGGELDPAALADGDPAALAAQLESVDLRWRLDHLMALRDLLDEVADEHPDT